MRQNHIPQSERLKGRINSLQLRLDKAWQNGRRGNPYQKCRHCGIHTPQLSINDGRHFKGCLVQGLDKEIAYYKKLLNNPLPPPTKKRSRYEILSEGVPIL